MNSEAGQARKPCTELSPNSTHFSRGTQWVGSWKMQVTVSLFWAISRDKIQIGFTLMWQGHTERLSTVCGRSFIPHHIQTADQNALGLLLLQKKEEWQTVPFPLSPSPDLLATCSEVNPCEKKQGPLCILPGTACLPFLRTPREAIVQMVFSYTYHALACFQCTCSQCLPSILIWVPQSLKRIPMIRVCTRVGDRTLTWQWYHHKENTAISPVPDLIRDHPWGATRHSQTHTSTLRVQTVVQQASTTREWIRHLQFTLK